MNRRGFGTDGEYAVSDFLTGQGYRVTDMHYRRGPGEIDVIARQGARVVFVEVKRRSSARYGRPAEAVTSDKRRRIVRTALLYLQEKRLVDCPVRFDIVELSPGRINHIEDAFDASDIF